MNAKKSRGFTLLEAMIVLVVVGVVAAISLDMLTGQARAEARRQMVSQQATEMATINRAVTEWVRTATGLPTTAGQIQEIALQDVINAGRLPAEFARRPASGSNVPTSPLGQQYRAFVRRTAGSNYEIAVFPLGPLNAGFAARAGITNEPESLRVWNVGVMQEIRSKFTLPAGVINQGSSAVDSAASGFTLDLADFLGGNAAEMTVAALANFSELQTITEGEDEKVESFVGKTCRSVRNEECAPDEAEAAEIAVCNRWGSEFQGQTALSEVVVTPVGNVTVNRTAIEMAVATIEPLNDPNATPRITQQWNGSTTMCTNQATNFTWACVGAANGVTHQSSNKQFNVFGAGSRWPQGSSHFITMNLPRMLQTPAGHGVGIGENQSATRVASAARCSGSSSNAVPMLLWEAAATHRWQPSDIWGSGGFVNEPLDGVRLTIASIMPPANAGSATGTMFTRVVTRARFEEDHIAAGSQTVQRYVCEHAQISTGSTQMNSATGGLENAVNGCPSTGFMSPSTGSQQRLEMFISRLPASQQPVTRICCK